MEFFQVCFYVAGSISLAVIAGAAWSIEDHLERIADAHAKEEEG